MKKALFTLALLAGLTGAAQAQRSNVSLGIKAGPSYSSFIGAQATNYESAFGFHAGVFANIGLTDLFAFQPEIIYSQKGAKVPNIDLTTRLNYVDIPLSFHVNADGLFFEAGPQLGLLVLSQGSFSNKNAGWSLPLDGKTNHTIRSVVG